MAPPSTAQQAIEAYGVDAIIEDLESGKSLRQIARELGIAGGSLRTWVEADPARSQACARAREEGSEHWDNESSRVIESAEDAFALAKAKELAVHYRWRAKAIAPRKYGERQDVNVTGSIDVRATFAAINAAANARTDRDPPVA